MGGGLLISVCFSLVSLPFSTVIADQLGFMPIFVPFYLTVCVASLACALIMPRIYTLNKIKDTTYNNVVHLKEELVPAMGCTEPIALAYGAAKAREVLGCIPERVVVEASGSIIKNIKSVIVPNTNQLKGIPAAVAAGVVAGKPEKELEVISAVTEDEIVQIREFMYNTDIFVEHVNNGITFDIIVTMYKGESYAKVRIANYHTNIVLIEKDGEILHQIEIEGEEESGLTDRSLLNLEDIWDFANTVDVEDVRKMIGRQIRYNTAIAEEGLRGNYGSNIGRVLLDAYGGSRFRRQNERV